MMIFSRLLRNRLVQTGFYSIFFVITGAYAQEVPSLPASRCPATLQDRITGVDQARIVLQSGLHIRLADIRLPDEAPERDQAYAFLASLKGQDVEVSPASSKPDRWNVQAADVVLQQTQLPLSWALVDAGLAIVDLGEASALCRPELLKVEREARGSKRGLWHNPVLLSAQDEAALQQAAGRFVLVEGRVRSIAHRGRISYINLGPDIKRHVTLVIYDPLRRNSLNLLNEMKGQQVRMRGILSTEPEPRLVIHSLELVELVKSDQIMFVPKQ
jgi:endonuclease YncB( thermonuclease family)